LHANLLKSGCQSTQQGVHAMSLDFSFLSFLCNPKLLFGIQAKA